MRTTCSSTGPDHPFTPPSPDRRELRLLLIQSPATPGEDIQALLRDEFPNGDIAVATTLDGALARLAESEYDLILADPSLPEAEGKAVVRAVRHAFPHTRLVALKDRTDGTLATWTPAGGAPDFVLNGKQHGTRMAEAILHAARDGRMEQMPYDHLTVAMKLESEAAQRLREIEITKSDLVEIASHELRTPLTVIAAHAEMLLDEGGLTARQTESVDAIIRNASRLAALTAELSMLSNFNSIQVEKKMEAVDLSVVVQWARTELQSRWSSKRLDIRLHLPSEQVLVTGDSGQLQHLVGNLISNAINFTDNAGTVTCRLSTTATDVVLAVIDTGCGIPAAEHAQLFTKFFRGSHLDERSVRGTGLGLHFAASIVGNHGGHIWVDSLEGVGSSFNVRLPRRLSGKEPTQSQLNASLGASLVSLLDLPATDPEVGDIANMLQAALEAARQTSQWELVADTIDFTRKRLTVRGLSQATVHDICSVVESAAPAMSAADLDRLHGSLRRGASKAATSPSASAPLGAIETTYLGLLLLGDRTGAVALMHRCVSEGMDPSKILLGILEPVQREVGRRWAQGHISVIQEHFCTSVTKSVMRDLRPESSAKERRDQRLLAVHAPGSLHHVGLRMVTDVLEGRGWGTTYVDDDVTAATLIELLTLHQPDVLLMSASMPHQIPYMRALMETVRQCPLARNVKIVVGGRPFVVAPALADAIGADGWAPDAHSAVDVCNELIADDTKRTPKRGVELSAGRHRQPRPREYRPNPNAKN